MNKPSWETKSPGETSGAFAKPSWETNPQQPQIPQNIASQHTTPAYLSGSDYRDQLIPAESLKKKTPIDQRIKLSNDPSLANDTRNYIGMNLIPANKEDNTLAKIGKGIINYGAGGVASLAGNIFSSLGQAGMQLVTNTDKAIKGQKLDFTQKSLKKDILPKQYGQFVDNLAQKGSLGELASGFIQGGVEGSLDPGTWAGGMGMIDDLNRMGLAGRSAKVGTMENLSANAARGQNAVKGMKPGVQSATREYLNAERNALKKDAIKTPDVIHANATGTSNQLLLPSPAKQQPFTQVKYSTLRTPKPEMQPAVDNVLLDSIRKRLNIDKTSGELARETGAKSVNMVRRQLDLGGTQQVGQGIENGKSILLPKKPQQVLFTENSIDRPFIGVRGNTTKVDAQNPIIKPMIKQMESAGSQTAKLAGMPNVSKAPTPSIKIVPDKTGLETMSNISKEPTKFETIKGLIRNSDKWKDKNGVTGPLRLQRETEERNIIDVAGKDGGKVKEALFTPVHEHEAANVRMKNTMRNTVKSFNLTQKESEAVQKFGEGKWIETKGGIDPQTGQKVTGGIEHTYTLADLKQEFPDSWQKLVKAKDAFNSMYKDLIDQANTALVRNGYKPVGELKNYFPHFQGDDPVMKALGIRLDVEDLPTDINGLTHQFKPGKKWVGNFLHREGQKTNYDAVEGFDRYIEGVGKVIHHTDDIQNLRTFVRELRLKYSPKEIQDQVAGVMESDMPKELKDAALDELLSRSKTHLSNYVSNLEEYTNVLAGKKDLADRAAERTFGRKIYNIANVIENRVGKNMVALNPASWITNFIPITQSLATTNKKAVIEGLADTMKNVVQNDGFINKSTFLTNRVGSDALSKSIVEKSGDVLTAPFKWIDNFTSQVVTRSKYLEGIGKGLSPDTAMKQADEWAAKIMGDRSAGAQPTLFNQRNPLTRVFTQFQLEVNNQLSFLLKDMPREYMKDGANAANIAKLTSAIGQMVVYGWVYNQLYEQLTGRRPALDPIGVAFDFKEDLNNPNLKKSDAILNLANNVTQQLPFAGSVLGGGRIPISSAFPDGTAIADATAEMAGGEITTDKGLSRVGKEMLKPALYLIPPFGGGQAKKTFEGLSAVNQGGDYYTSPSGERSLKYPIEQSAGNTAKATLFGKYSLPESQRYYRNQANMLGANQTAEYDKAVSQGADKDAMFKLYLDQRKRDAERAKASTLEEKYPELRGEYYPDFSFTYNKQKVTLTPDQYERYRTIAKNEFDKLLSSIENNQRYDVLPEDKKDSLIQSFIKKANNIAKLQLLK